MFNPLVSIVICAYNVELYIEKCIRSVLSQTYQNIEIICVNDCSTDKTLAILQRIALEDSRIKVISHNTNSGRSETRNTGIKLARGEFISFIDGDDEIKQNTYEKLIPHFSDPSIDVVWFGIDIVYESHEHLRKSDNEYYAVKQEGIGVVPLNELLQYDCSSCNKIFRRNQLTTDLLFHGRYYEDALFFMKFFAKKRKVFFVKEKYYIYYRHQISIMSSTMNRTEGLAINHIFILDEVIEFWKKEKLLPKNNNIFNEIFAAYFWLSYRYCLPYERAWVIAEATKRLRAWKTGPLVDPVLRSLYEGTYKITLVPVAKTSDIAPKKLKGLEKILCLRNEDELKVLRLFGKRLFMKERKFK